MTIKTIKIIKTTQEKKDNKKINIYEYIENKNEEIKKLKKEIEKIGEDIK
jgi:hypothetical protein